MSAMRRCSPALILLLAVCSPVRSEDAIGARVEPRPSPSPVLTDPLPSFPSNVTYAGWVIVIDIADDLVVAKATMGSPPAFQGRVVVLRGRHDLLTKGQCVLVEFVAQPEADREGTHRLVGLDLGKRPTNEQACPSN